MSNRPQTPTKERTHSTSLQLPPRGRPACCGGLSARGSTTAQLYRLSKLAREKLCREATCADYNLLKLVGHANLLDDVIERLEDADEEWEPAYVRCAEGVEGGNKDDGEDDGDGRKYHQDGSDDESSASGSDSEEDSSDDEDWGDFRGDCGDGLGEEDGVEDCLCGCDTDGKGLRDVGVAKVHEEVKAKMQKHLEDCVVLEEVDLSSLESLLDGVQLHSYGSVPRTAELMLSYS